MGDNGEQDSQEPQPAASGSHAYAYSTSGKV